MTFGKRKACAPSERHNLFDFLARADTAVRPYAEFVHTTKINSTDKLTNAMPTIAST